MTTPRRPRSHRAQPERTADLVADMMARLGGQERGTEQKVFAAYTSSVGALLAKHSRPERLRGDTLFVRVDSSVLAHELGVLKGELIERLTRALGAGVVADVRTRVGPLDS